MGARSSCYARLRLRCFRTIRSGPCTTGMASPAWRGAAAELAAPLAHGLQRIPTGVVLEENLVRKLLKPEKHWRTKHLASKASGASFFPNLQISDFKNYGGLRKLMLRTCDFHLIYFFEISRHGGGGGPGVDPHDLFSAFFGAPLTTASSGFIPLQRIRSEFCRIQGF